MKEISKKKDTYLHMLVIIGFAILAYGCSNANENYRGGSYYFKDWVSYKIPFKPYNRISYDEAKNRLTFYEAHYDSAGRIVSFKKYLHNRLEWQDTYTYYENGILSKREMIMQNGERRVQYFDRDGKLREEN